MRIRTIVKRLGIVRIIAKHYHTVVETIQALRNELIRLLSGKGAHADFDQAVSCLPPHLHGTKPEGAPHTAWELLEHLRIAQWDMLEFSRNSKHVSPEWPLGYWPATPVPPDPNAWEKSVAAFKADASAMSALVADPATDLNQAFAWGEGQTLLREVLQLADHNAYHLGELVFLRRSLGSWE